jgi:cytochrome oxidase assembly protein ShyY1
VSILRLAMHRRWLGWLGLTTAFAVACVLLAQWQWQRRLDTVADIRVVAANWDAPPLTLAEALPVHDLLDPDTQWQPVEITGEYLRDEQLLVRTRPLSGRPGFEVLTPLLLDDGRVFVVNRGWLPVGSAQDSPDVVPEPPAGRVEVVARLKPGEPELRGRGAPAGQIATIHLPDIAERVDAGDVIEGAYGLLSSESPSPDTRPIAATRPVPDEGPHLSYTFQWYVFALMGFIGYGWALRKERQRLVAEETGEPVAPRNPRRPSDADEEDALLDAR